jgi:hypothetical protein
MTDELTPLQLAQLRRQEMKEQGIEIERLDPIQKLAINAHCFGCVGAGADPNPRGLIRDCEVAGCALYGVRPYQSKTGVGGEATTTNEELEIEDED